MIERTEGFTFRRETLFPLADQFREQYQTASPFPHVVIDNFLPEWALAPVLEEFPERGSREWDEFNDGRQVKLALADTEMMGSATRHLLAQFNTGVFVDFLERLTGITGLVSDPHYVGGGLHQIRQGGYLKVHADFNKHSRLDLDRRLNGILYLNREWDDSYGGHIQLWDQKMEKAEHSILPIFNRFILFRTTDDANHGHPDPLTCPPDRARRSMALYYYTAGRPSEEAAPSHTTLFKARPGEAMAGTRKQRLLRWVPPAALDIAYNRQQRKAGAPQG